MESKLLVGGKNIVDHTNEQQRILEQKRHEIAEQVHIYPIFLMLQRKALIIWGLKTHRLLGWDQDADWNSCGNCLSCK